MQLFPFVLRAALAFAPPAHGQPVAVPADQGALEMARFDGDVVARVLIRSAPDLVLVNQLSNDMWSHGVDVGGEADFRLSQFALDTLGKVGVPYRVLIPDLQERIDDEQVRLAQPAEGADWFADFKNLAAVNARLDALVAAHPTLVSIVTAGTSIQGRTIRGVRISRYPAGTNVPAFIFTGTAHAREWAATMTTMWIADQLIEQDGIDPRITAILNSAEVYIFPVQNPDGYEYSWTNNRLWRKNRRLVSGSTYGVDMNRNWSIGWGGAGSSGVASNETYRGTAAFSEPETAGMRDFMLAHAANLCGFIDFHSYGQEWLWSWSYTNTVTPDEAALQAVGYPMQTALGSLYGTSYAAGRSYAIYGAVAGCIDDWGYGTIGMMSGTLEVRDLGSYGFVMPTSAIIPNARENHAAAMVMMEKLLASCPVSITLGPGSTVAENTPATVEALAVPNISTLIANGVRLKWSVDGGATQSAVMTSIGSNKYRATLPGIACGSQLTWFVEAETKFIVTRAPLNVPTSFNVSAAPACGNPADLDGSGEVDGGDLGLMLLDFGVCPVPADCPADLDGSGEVDGGDVGLLLLEYS
ncbi:MAG: M14 family metallocarboxypeptidase [Planctomycetes bacterium]|nr:M14 family metallocarboxypeptidase [Planctomycetota bacterium]